MPNALIGDIILTEVLRGLQTKQPETDLWLITRGGHGGNMAYAPEDIVRRLDSADFPIAVVGSNANLICQVGLNLLEIGEAAEWAVAIKRGTGYWEIAHTSAVGQDGMYTTSHELRWDGWTPSIRATMDKFFNSWESFERSSQRTPMAWNEYIHSAVMAKRAGDDATSVAIYVELTLESRVVYSSLLGNLYKPLACSGHLRDAAGVLLVLKRVLEDEPLDTTNDFGIESKGQSSYDLYYPLLREATASKQSMENYLAPFSGRGDYRFPRDFAAAVAEYQEFIDQGAELTSLRTRTGDAQAPAPGKGSAESTAKPSNSGCYIATAVYGSYDAPEVLILRKFRDDVLGQTAVGRVATTAYYRLSPPIASLLRDAPAVNARVRKVLDVIVAKLRTG